MPSIFMLIPYILAFIIGISLTYYDRRFRYFYYEIAVGGMLVVFYAITLSNPTSTVLTIKGIMESFGISFYTIMTALIGMVAGILL